MCLWLNQCSYLDSTWSGIKEQLTSESLQFSHVLSTLEQQALQPLQAVLIGQLEKRFYSIVSDGKKLLKDYSTAKVLLQKSRDKYFRYFVLLKSLVLVSCLV